MNARPARQAAREARPATPEGERASDQCLKDLTDQPETIDGVRGWLRPDHFATPGQGETYSVLRDMHAAGKPIDTVTASREISRRGVQASLDDGVPGQAETSARELHKHATAARVGRVGRISRPPRATEPRGSPPSSGPPIEACGTSKPRPQPAASMRGSPPSAPSLASDPTPPLPSAPTPPRPSPPAVPPARASRPALLSQQRRANDRFRGRPAPARPGGPGEHPMVAPDRRPA